MKIPRHHHACGTINYNAFLVAGGKDQFYNTIDLVEIFYLANFEWKNGLNLPDRISHSSSIQYGTTILIIGGLNGFGYPKDTVYQFDESEFEWVTRNEKLINPRSGHLAIPLESKSLAGSFQFFLTK